MIRTDVTSNLRSIAFFSSGDGDPLSVLRVLGPASTLGIEVINGIANNEVFEEAVHRSDLILLQRDYCRHLDDFEHVFILSKSLGKPIVYDLDDLLFELPEDHPDISNHYYSNALLPMLQSVMEADLVTVSTRKLREYLHKYNDNIEVFPNYLNDNLWTMREPRARLEEHGDVCIGFMGGSSHEPDIKMVLPAIQEIVKKYPDRIKLYFWGMKPPQELGRQSHVEWHPPSSGKYSDFADTFHAQKADILIAPLVDNLFNSCKSGLKYLEYSAVGVPGVYSRIDPYIEMVHHGENGFLASTTEEWIDSLTKLIENPGLCEKLARNAQRHIRQKWLLSENSGKLSQIYRNLLSAKNQNTKVTSPLHGTIRSINRQVNTLISYKDEKIGSLSKLIEEKNRTLDVLENQVIQRNDTLHTLGEQLTESNRKLDELSKEVNENKQGLIALQNQLFENNQKLEELSIEIAQGKQGEYVLTNMIGEKDKEIGALSEKLDESNQLINELETKLRATQEEVVAYYMSTSWQITRPIRKLINLLKGR